MNNFIKILAVLVIPVMLFGCGKNDKLQEAAEKFVEKSVDDFVENIEVENGCVTTVLIGKKVAYCDERLASVDKLIKDNLVIEDAE